MADVKDVAQEEMVRQFIVAAFAIVVLVSQRHILLGGESTEIKMLWAHRGEEFCQRQAERWAKYADRFKRIYDRYRL